MTTFMTFIALALAPLLPACEFEDSTFCTWTATEQGNGIGASYVDIGGVAYYFGD